MVDALPLALNLCNRRDFLFLLANNSSRHEMG